MSRRLNVALQPGSPAHRRFNPPAPPAPPAQAAPAQPPAPSGLAPGFTANPEWDLHEEGGPTIAELTFINCYLGSKGAWADEDVRRIDGALSSAFTDANLEGVIAQYYQGPIRAAMLPSIRREQQPPPVFHKNDAEQLAKQLGEAKVLGAADPANSMVNIMLPRGTVLSTEPSGTAPEGELGEPQKQETGTGGKAETTARASGDKPAGHAAIGDDDTGDVESSQGLGGYHGAVALPGEVKLLYAVGVYSEGGNGIVAFDEPWKNVVATFYHEINEARTDPDVEEASDTNHDALLGWYSQAGEGEIGDLPINASGNNLALVFKEIPLADGSGTVPIQLMWSNAAHGPAASR